ncbi:ComEC/Rec2 family competence protein [Falsirhodobacter sp. 1013]|uniref:ComEC/Rec2 family competence protein n=1 Tax=Falsirhodobacter sp. 1013 TaxID=3417566 RepID=UPI003EB764A0
MKDKLVAPLVTLSGMGGTLFPLLPVFLGTGIALWFALPRDPSALGYGLAGMILLVLTAVALRGPFWCRVPAWGLVALVAGFLLIGLRAWLQEAPILGFRYYGAVEGRVVEIDRSAGDDLRLTLDRVLLERTDPARTPDKVRISLHADRMFFDPEPGARVMMTAHLSTPMPPSEPGGFDFRRMAFFQRLGAIGYTQTPVLTLEPPEPSARLVGRMRAWLSEGVTSRIDGQAGAFAAGAVTGDRSAITQDTVEALRDSNLSHLLAISGMNLAFLVGFTFAILRYGLALIPWVALRLDTKKIAAVASLGVAGFYLALSGGNVATERAFIMSAIMLGAILVERRALSMRTVALSALILLALQPEALVNAGFQMSMAATAALVWGFGIVDRLTFRQTLPRWTVPVYTALLSSVIGGLATGPIAAAQFNRFAEFGLLANLLTVPAMGTLIMPGAVIAALLGPFGLPQPGLWLMELGARWILIVAHWVAGWNGAVIGIPSPSSAVMPLMILGAIWAMVWPDRWRALGAVPMVAALALWGVASRPAVLVSGDGLLVGVMGPEGRILSHPRGGSFAAKSWLQRDGDLAVQTVAAARPGFEDQGEIRVIDLGGVQLAHLKGKAAEGHAADACGMADIVIMDRDLTEEVPAGCSVYDTGTLRDTGALSLRVEGESLRITPTLGTRRSWDQ